MTMTDDTRTDGDVGRHGDAVVNGPYNNVNDAYIENWPTVLRAAQKLKVKHVLPGHGLPGGRELLTGQEQFMTELFKAVKDGAAQGKKVEELQAQLQRKTPVILVEALPEKYYLDAHLPGAINIPHDAVDALAPRLLPDKTAEIVVYCANGNRSAFAADTLQQMGYGEVESMAELARLGRVSRARITFMFS